MAKKDDYFISNYIFFLSFTRAFMLVSVTVYFVNAVIIVVGTNGIFSDNGIINKPIIYCMRGYI